MRKLLLVSALAVGGMSAADLSGIWEGNGVKQDPKYGSIPGHIEMTLLQAGSSLTGTAKLNNNKPVAITSGSVSGSQVTVSATTVAGTLVTGSFTIAANGQLQGRMTSSTGLVYSVSFVKQ